MKTPVQAITRRRATANPILHLLLPLLLLSLVASQSARAQSYVLSNLWSAAAGSAAYPFLSKTDNNTRGLAYNPATDHLLVVSRTSITNYGTNVIYGTNSVYILDRTTGAVTGKLPEDPSIVKGGTFVLNMIGITDDGVIYVGNLTTDATNTTSGPFKLYRWANESAQPQLVYSGDPSFTNTNGASPRRFGDSLALRGSGTGTQILLGTFNQVVGLLTTADGTNFAATKIVTDAAAEETRRALAWGAGNTFWAKGIAGNLRQFTLNLANQTASNTTTIALSSVYTESLDVDVSRNLAALVCTNHTLRLYDIFDPAAPIQQDVTRTFPSTTNANGNWVGSAALRNGKLFAMDVNNGILAYLLSPIYLPPTIITAPTGVTIWEGAAYWTFSAAAGGTRPLTYQWQFGGTDIPGATSPTLTISNITTANQGYFRMVVSNAAGWATSGGALMTVVSSAASDQVTNLWNVAADTRPYLTSGYKEYGVAINPVTTNVIVVTRANPTNMIAVLDMQTGAHLHYIDYTGLPLVGGMNKVCVADDGVIFVCNLTTDTATAKFTIYGFADDSPTPVTGWLYNDDPGAGVLASTVGWGANIDARGGGPSTEILIGAGKYSPTVYDANAVAILRYNDSMSQFVSTPIVITNLPVSNNNFRFGLCWGAGESFWAKGLNGLMYIEFDRIGGKGGVKYTYPTTGARSVPSSVTGMAFDGNTGLLAALQNGSPPTPVSVPFYDVSDPAAGPLWVDHELFTSYNADIEFQGSVSFEKGYAVALGVNNGLKAFKVNPNFVGSLPVILSQPTGGTWFENTSPTLTVVADSASPLTYQWYYYGTQTVAGATSASLTITNITPGQAGDYMVRVSNTGGSRDSRFATLSVVPLYNTGQMSNIWSLLPGTRPYLNTGYFEYGMSFNPANSNLVVASYVSTNATPIIVAVLDALTGADKNILDLTTVTNGGNRPVNKVGVAEDGVVYVGNRTTSPATLPFVVYRWADDKPGTVASVAFKGDPFSTMNPNKNCGWTMDIRGSGVDTEILLSTSNTNVVSILTTTDGVNFTAKEILVAGAPAAFGRLGICFGAGSTFWAKAWQGDGGLLRLVQYNLAAGTGTILWTYTTAQVSSTMTTIAYNDTLKFLAGMARDDQENVQVYGVSDLDYGPVLLDQEVFPTYYPSIEANGALDFGGNNYLFALDQNNGVMAFQINASYVPPVSHFKILSVKAAGADAILTWEAQNGASYQVQYVDAMGDSWKNLGTPVMATGTTASYTNTVPGNYRFYRVVTPYTGP